MPEGVGYGSKTKTKTKRKRKTKLTKNSKPLTPEEIGEKFHGKPKAKKNPPAKSQIRSLSKKQDKDDAMRTREFEKHKRKRPISNALTNDRSAKTVANFKTDGMKGKSHLKDITPSRGSQSREERLKESKMLSGVSKFFRATDEDDKKKSKKIIKRIRKKDKDKK